MTEHKKLMARHLKAVSATAGTGAAAAASGIKRSRPAAMGHPSNKGHVNNYPLSSAGNFLIPRQLPHVLGNTVSTCVASTELR
jgi:hypothetical protein